jgi:hypothetical protein
MDYDDIMFKLRGYLEDQNYVAACLFIKKEDIPEDARNEISGEVAKHVVENLATEKNKEKIIYLRSILVWLFKDIPGLASVYREQLRLSADNANMMRDFVRGVRNFADVATGGESESLGEKIDEATENLKPEAMQEKVKDFFSDAGIDLDDGMKKARDFFDTLAGGRQHAKDAEPRDVDDSEEQ